MCLPLIHKFLKHMKKITLLAALFAAMTINATDLWTGAKHVSWNDGGVQIQKEAFANAQPGQKIVVSFTGASDGIEFKVMNANFDHLAGSREAAWLNDNGTYEQFLTAKAVEQIKANGLQIVGKNFTCTKVELLDGKVLKEGVTVWTGFFWADEWKTLELYVEGYNYVDFSKATALRIYSEANRDDYFVKLLDSWDEGGIIADNGDFAKNTEYAELALTDGLRTRLANAGHWMIQFNKEAGAAFNVTDVVLVMEKEATAIENTVAEQKAVKAFENDQLVIIKNGVKFNALGVKL